MLCCYAECHILFTIMLNVVMLSVVAPLRGKEKLTKPGPNIQMFIISYSVCPGSVISNGREPRSCLCQVFNFRLGSFVSKQCYWITCARPHLELKTWPRFCPVSRSLFMVCSQQDFPALSNQLSSSQRYRVLVQYIPGLNDKYFGETLQLIFNRSFLTIIL